MVWEQAQRSNVQSAFVSSFFLTYGVTSNNNNISSNKVSSHASHDNSNNAPHVIAMPLTKHLPQTRLQNHSTSNNLCFLRWFVYFVWFGIEKTSLTLLLIHSTSLLNFLVPPPDLQQTIFIYCNYSGWSVMFSRNWIVVVSTVVPTSFAAVDSFDKTRFRFIAGHRVDYRCGEQTQGGKSDVLALDLFAQH